MGLSRVVGAAGIGLGLLLSASIADAAILQVAQTQQPPAPLPPAVVDSITQAACDPTKLLAAVKTDVTANPALAADIATVAVGQCPTLAASIAAAAASADPTDAAAIVVAVIAALPPGQQEANAPLIVAAVEQAVPDSSNQVTTAITALAFNAGQGTGGRSNVGAPLVAPHTDVQVSVH
jgi:hypothetical protein